VPRPAGQQGERAPWDLGRFFKTVIFFNPPPSPQDVLGKLLRGLPGQAPPREQGSSAVQTLVWAQAAPMPGATAGGEQPVVLVVGATGGVGKRVVARLLARGCRVRALVRDLAKARELLGGLPAGPGGSLELAAADLTQRATLLPEMVRGVRSVVCCSAVKVAPKEGDTVDRQKYMQGIKFFDPEIVGECGCGVVPCSGRRQGQAAAGAALLARMLPHCCWLAGWLVPACLPACLSACRRHPRGC
jgi:hypothetical protein